jgi:DegV family protein with EDD domain
MSYKIMTDASADLPLHSLVESSQVSVIPMNIFIDGKTYIYGPEGNLLNREFYELQKCAVSVSTSQISPNMYQKYFERELQKGKDILYIGVSSALSASYHNAEIAADLLKKQYPQRNIRCVDSLTASVGQGLLVLEAIKRQTNGATLEQVSEWILMQRSSVCTWFSVDHLVYLVRGGRVSVTAASLGKLFDCKSILQIASNGSLELTEKMSGRRRISKLLLKKVEAYSNFQINPAMLIGTTSDFKQNQQFVELIRESFTQTKPHIVAVGPITGCHTGPGMLGLAFLGNNVQQSHN